MKRFVMMACLLCLPLVSQAADLNGLWVGYYRYDANQQAVECTMVLTHKSDGEIAGAMVEPQTFGDTIEPGMPSDIVGVLCGANLQFEKYYFHEDEHAEPVIYKLTVSADGNMLSGSWKIGSVTGMAQFRRVTVSSVGRIPAP